VAATLVSACGNRPAKGVWTVPNGDLAGTRAASGSSLDASNVARLRVRWRFRFTEKPSFSGIFASTPIADRDTVYVQDLRSNVYALDRSNGALRWARRYRARNDGPNGLAVVDNRVYGATDSDAFGLDAETGRQLWRRHLTSASEQLVDVAPVVWEGFVLLSTVGYPPSGRGAIYALDAATGTVRWRFVTIQRPWKYPREAGGGGLWYPVSIDRHGRLYGGNSNPAPWGGTRKRPNGGSFPGPALYTDSLLVLDARTGKLLWHDQVTPHDIRDYDFEATPVIAGTRVIGAGKAGLVIAWDRDTRRRLWTTRVGLHRNDVGPLPRRKVTVCPGLLGGVETPMAYADERVFVTAVDLCVPESAISTPTLDSVDPSRGTGLLAALDAATGDRLWTRRFPSPDFGCATVANDVVFTSTYDGTVYGLAARDGRVLWRAKLRAGLNSCPAIAGDQLFVGAGVPRRGSVEELVAFALR
jgi:outer membrane protein assembly factor BamB